MSKQEPIKIGRFSLFAVRDGNFRLDGGAMFGVIPKTTWAKEHPPDDRNRIEMAVRCLLIVDGDRRFLVDPGLDFFDDAGKDKYGVDHSTFALDRELARVGFTRADITDVILTHLHLDHCGYGKEHEHEEDRFPNATYYLQRSHLAWARAPNEKDALSFRIEDVERLERTRKLRLLDGDTWLAPGLQLFLCEGHTIGMQLVRVTDGGKSAVFVGDLIPSALYLRLSWVSAYDLDPLQMVKDKKNLLAEATTQGTILFFGHDRSIAGCTVTEEGGRVVVAEVVATGESAYRRRRSRRTERERECSLRGDREQEGADEQDQAAVVRVAQERAAEHEAGATILGARGVVDPRDASAALVTPETSP